MGIFTFVTRRHSDRLIAQEAAEVASRSYGPVMARVGRRASAMRVAEGRGYVRARALHIVHRELAALHENRIPHDPDIQTRIISRATDSVVASALAELRSVPRAAKPVHRRAA